MTLTAGEGTNAVTAARSDLAPPAGTPGGATPAPPAGARSGATPTEAVDPVAEPRVGRAVVAGTLLGFVAVLVVVAGGGILSGLDPMGALGLGVFIGMWGGAGFGFMTGGALSLARHADAEHRAPAAHR